MNAGTITLKSMDREHAKFYLSSISEINTKISIIDCEKMFSQMTIFDKSNDSFNKVLINLKHLALQSKAEKRKVASIIVEKGMTYGGNNYCELFPNTSNNCELVNGQTSPFTIHAEEAAIFNYYQNKTLPFNCEEWFDEEKMMFTTFSPCHNCARMIVQFGVKKIYIVNVHSENFENAVYNENNELVNISVLNYLINHGITVNYITNSELNNLKELK